jgi:fermentation-respiration switch protein FrsA (DUF1100 family)
MSPDPRTPTALARAARTGLTIVFAVLATPASALAAGVHPLFDVTSASGAPFPSDVFTVSDAGQNTGSRVNLPKPDCATHPTDCDDVDTLNVFDGFNRKPRISVPFDGAIDPATVSSDTVFLIGLGDAVADGEPAGAIVGIDAILWDVASRTLHFEPDAVLAEHARYAVVVTRNVHDARGDPIEASDDFDRFRRDLNPGQAKRVDPATAEQLKAYRKSLLEAEARAHQAGVRPADLAVASVFTTFSTTAMLRMLRDQLQAAPPPRPAELQAVFPVADISAVTHSRQISADPRAALRSAEVNLPLLQVARELAGDGVRRVGHIALGTFESPNYLATDVSDPAHGLPNALIPPVPTRTGQPQRLPVQASAAGSEAGQRRISFVLFLPDGAPPTASGWPVALIAHGSGNNKLDVGFAVASVMAAHGLATITFDLPGHGFGPASTVTVRLGTGDVTVPSPGRGVDLDSNGTIGNAEGSQGVAARALLFNRDAIVQGAVDVMQLSRVIEAGVEIGGARLDASRFYAAGNSLGGAVAMLATALDPRIRAGAFTAPGGGAQSFPFSPVTRGGVGAFLRARVPSPLEGNVPGLTQIGGVAVGQPFFNDNTPLPHHAPVVNTVPRAMDIQQILERLRWAGQPSAPTLIAELLRVRPLPGVQPRPFIVQVARGDQQAVTPSIGAWMRAGALRDRVTLLRHDEAFTARPDVQKNPHTLLFRTDAPAASTKALALALQDQVASFFESDGATVVDPDEIARPTFADDVFEVPIGDDSVRALDDMNYIP